MIGILVFIPFQFFSSFGLYFQVMRYWRMWRNIRVARRSWQHDWIAAKISGQKVSARKCERKNNRKLPKLPLPLKRNPGFSQKGMFPCQIFQKEVSIPMFSSFILVEKPLETYGEISWNTAEPLRKLGCEESEIVKRSSCSLTFLSRSFTFSSATSIKA